MGKNIEPLVSVIVPVFNVAPYVEDAINSVLNQSYDNLEVIIIDDGSTDGSGALCDAYAEKDHRIHVIHQNNKGLSAARNAGLDIMTGDMVAFLDSDDIFHLDFIRNTLGVMIHENADIVICQFCVYGREIENKNDETEPLKIYNRIEALRALVDRSIDHVVWNKLYRKELWSTIRYPEGHVYEDVDTSYRVINLCRRIVSLRETLYYKRKRPKSITNTHSRKNIEDWLLAYSHLESFINNTPGIFTEEEVAQYQRAQLFRLVRFYYVFSRGNGADEKELSEKIRQMIVEVGSIVGAGDWKLSTKMNYYMIVHCPSLFSLTNRAYGTIRKLYRHK